MDGRPLKRAKLEGPEDTKLPLLTRGHEFGNLEARGSALVQQGDHFGTQNHYHYSQNPANNTAGSKEDKYDVLHKSLLFPRMDARVHNVSKALPDTCDWIFQHKNFKEWQTGRSIREHNGFLWIKGKPGCGKSTIMKTTLEWARQQTRRKSSDTKVVYYFFNARASNSLEKSTLGFYRSLVYQILDVYPSLQSLFSSKFALKDPEDPGDNWTRNELQDFLSDMVHSDESYSLCILVDALDEGEKESDVRDMIHFLVDLSERALSPPSSLKLRICLSSRHYPHISIKKGLSLVVEDQNEHDQDIEKYVRKKLTGQVKLVDSDSSAKEELVTEVCRKSASIFLWVVLVVRMLDEVEDHPGLVMDMRTRLDEIPGDLNDLFADILKKSDHGVEACITLLQWVLFAMRPLGPSELYLATEYSRSPADSTWHPPNAIIVPPADRLCVYITDCSRGLVELTSARPPVVQFIHETVRDYLLQANGLALFSPALSSNLRGISHEVLRTGCIRYSSRCMIPPDFQRYQIEGHKTIDGLESIKEKINVQMPFINYSVSYVFSHAEQAQTYGRSQTEFLRQRMTSSDEWHRLERSWWNIFERFKVKKYSSSTTLLYFLAEQGLTFLVKQLLTISRFVNTKCGRYGSALQAACAVGNEGIVRSLIASGANINIICGEHKHALLTAIYTKHFPLIRVLVENGARLNQKLGQKTFFEMVARGSVQGVSHLLELGADINWVNSRKESPLKLAILRKRSEVVDLLLQHVDFQMQLGLDEMGAREKMLAIAATNGLRQIVSLLIHDSADINANNDAAIRNATSEGDTNMIRLLIENGANVHAKEENDSRSLLYTASFFRYEEIARLLIEKGVDVNAQGGRYGSALQAASLWGEAKLVQLLIENGADVNAQGGLYGNSLQAACHRGNQETARLLIEKGVDVNAQGGEYGSALQAASYTGEAKLVQLLIENGADVNARGGQHGTPLAVAAATYWSIDKTGAMRLLIEAGADVNLRSGRNDESPIEMAYRAKAEYSYKDEMYSSRIQLLLDAGAEAPSTKFVQSLIDKSI